MPTRRRQIIAAVVAVAAMSVAVAISLAEASSSAPRRITAAGVGGVKLGATYSSLRLAGLLGKVGPGCPVAGPKARSAPLRLPLQGGADLTATAPRRVATITIAGGASARGVGIGARLAAIKAAYPRMRLDHSSEQVFAITIAHVPKGGGGPLEFALSTKTGKVALIGVPGIHFCD